MAISIKDIEANIAGLAIQEELKPGGQKRVFRAVHDKYGDVVVKVVISGEERVQREIEIVTKHSIKHVPIIFLSGKIKSEGQNFLFTIEEYIPGKNLREYLSAQNCLSNEQALKLLGTLLRIAVELEDVGIVHRDIKPENIMVTNSGEYYLLDFGIARALNMTSLTAPGAVSGPHTPGYAAPELFNYNKTEIDSRADLFSIGVVAYEVLSGNHPFLDGTEVFGDEALQKTINVKPKRFEIIGDTQQLLMSFILTLMQKFPTRRPPTARKALDWFIALLPTIH